MARFPAASKSEKTKTFRVAPNCAIGDPRGTGKYLKGGDAIELTQKQAKFLMEKRIIDLDLPEFDASAPASSDSDPAEAGAGDQAEGAGDAASGGTPSADNVQAEGDSTPSRGRSRRVS